MHIYLSETTDPYLNLACETWLLQQEQLQVPILFLWRNSPAIVIGRGQNPWLECNLSAIKEDQIPLLRRISGGGAVFHDLGNCNFSFISNSNSFSRKLNIQLMMHSLKNLRIETCTSDRYDLWIKNTNGEKRKISGSAFKLGKKRSLQHNTLLIGSDLKNLRKYLRPPEQDIISKGVRSVPAQVSNLTEIQPHLNYSIIYDSIINSFCDHYGERCNINHLSQQMLLANSDITKIRDSYSDWHWCYGKTMNFQQHFEQQFSWGKLQLTIHCQKGLIHSIESGNTNSTYFANVLQEKLYGTPFND